MTSHPLSEAAHVYMSASGKLLIFPAWDFFRYRHFLFVHGARCEQFTITALHGDPTRDYRLDFRQLDTGRSGSLRSSFSRVLYFRREAYTLCAARPNLEGLELPGTRGCSSLGIEQDDDGNFLQYVYVGVDIYTLHQDSYRLFVGNGQMHELPVRHIQSDPHLGIAITVEAFNGEGKSCLLEHFSTWDHSPSGWIQWRKMRLAVCDRHRYDILDQGDKVQITSLI